MNVHKISCSERLTAVLAFVFKTARKMNILNVFTKITLVITFFLADQAVK